VQHADVAVGQETVPAPLIERELDPRHVQNPQKPSHVRVHNGTPPSCQNPGIFYYLCKEITQLASNLDVSKENQ
jgi:hypothetical protein